MTPVTHSRRVWETVVRLWHDHPTEHLRMLADYIGTMIRYRDEPITLFLLPYDAGLVQGYFIGFAERDLGYTTKAHA